MTDAIKTQHNGTVITYNEKKNVWEFELRGHERSAVTLELARAAIDKPPPKDKPTFTRVKAYTDHDYNSDGFATVEVTSVAESPDWSETEYWVVTGKKIRQKLARSRLYPVNDRNATLIAKIQSLDDQREALSNEREALRKKLQQMPTQK